jgi:23S rRNA (pseudouridine1915-N3)-methyltransferase
LKIRIISVGKIREPFYISGLQEYLKRLRPYVKVEFLDGLEEKIDTKSDEGGFARLLDKEAERVLNLIKKDELLIALHLQGQELNSLELAEKIGDWGQSGKNRINFVVGSAWGLSPKIIKRADYVWSFSPLTFLHQMAVLILAEQIYRSYKILKGEPYHH